MAEISLASFRRPSRLPDSEISLQSFEERFDSSRLGPGSCRRQSTTRLIPPPSVLSNRLSRQECTFSKEYSLRSQLLFPFFFPSTQSRSRHPSFFRLQVARPLMAPAADTISFPCSSPRGAIPLDRRPPRFPPPHHYSLFPGLHQFLHSAMAALEHAHDCHSYMQG